MGRLASRLVRFLRAVSSLGDLDAKCSILPLTGHSYAVKPAVQRGDGDDPNRFQLNDSLKGRVSDRVRDDAGPRHQECRGKCVGFAFRVSTLRRAVTMQNEMS